MAIATNISPVVLVEELRLSVASRVLLDLERWEVRPAERAVVVGPSGSGKTTFLHVLAGLKLPAAGRVVVAGEDVGSMSEARRDVFRGQHIGFVHQTLHLVPALTVLENLHLAAFLVGRRVADEHLLGLLESVGLRERSRARTFELSHGEAQRVAIARALVNDPCLVLADEPTSALDDGNTQQILELLLKTTATQGAALVVATHDMRLLPAFERCLELGRGR